VNSGCFYFTSFNKEKEAGVTDSCAKLLADKGLTVVFIESATAGYLAHRFSVSPYSGDVLMGGLVCYS